MSETKELLFVSPMYHADVVARLESRATAAEAQVAELEARLTKSAMMHKERIDRQEKANARIAELERDRDYWKREAEFTKAKHATLLALHREAIAGADAEIVRLRGKLAEAAACIAVTDNAYAATFRAALSPTRLTAGEPGVPVCECGCDAQPTDTADGGSDE